MSKNHDATLGLLLIAVLVSGILWGVTCVQIWYYLRMYRKDKVILKGLVILAWLSDTTHQALITHGLYHYTVTMFGNQDGLEQNTPSLAIQTAVQAFTAFVVQCFYAERIWKFSDKNRFLMTAIVILILAQFSLVIANTVVNYQSQTFNLLHYNNRALTPACVSVGVVTDGLLAISMCVILHMKRVGSSGSEVFGPINNVIDRLMCMTLGTGAVTSICALALLVTYMALPNTFAWMGLYFLIGRLYVNSLLVALNVRSTLRQRYSDGHNISVNIGSHFNSKLPRSPISPSTVASSEV